MNNLPLHIVADENIPAVETLFGGFGSIRRLPGRHLNSEDVAGADVLLVRSISRVNAQLLAGSQVKFVGTATIGTDHIDQNYLQQQGISFSSAPGCNADAVVEYVISALYMLAAEQGFELLDKTVGIIGVGNVGGRLQRRMQGMGIKVLVNDPPRAAREGSESFTALDALLTEADIICCHTPLTTTGEHPSKHLLNKDNLDCLKSGAVLLNAGRGPVINNEDLLNWHRRRDDATLILDVWEHEPAVNAELAARARIGTPHIAGYSLEGKVRGTFMLYEAFCRAQGITPQLTLDDCLPRAELTDLTLEDTADVRQAIDAVYHPGADDQRFRDSLTDAVQQPQNFDRLRKEYPVRREFASLTLHGVAADSRRGKLLQALGFKLAEQS
ncbi:4-phosphoerythronate dehydrogenase PdxB [Aliamphritea hakodatensis]|uniref:4-phosphoerythronate dehydrogenase PdxB n=1 Tax=Aliamphritea hakodatensis TaxID=2895352 RepID=UPI0022FD65DF|nr:4-phosphoerythronate dehydrogenase PdxB [Aliamphritea hakodatensis]